jgi:hypothetical protein
VNLLAVRDTNGEAIRLTVAQLRARWVEGEKEWLSDGGRLYARKLSDGVRFYFAYSTSVKTSACS